MLTKRDCLYLISELESQGIDTSEINDKLSFDDDTITIELLDFINTHRQFEVAQFYEKLRKQYNSKHNKLYINIVKEEHKDPKETLITLSSLLTQILLFANGLDNPDLFIKHSRADDITKVLALYTKDYNITNAIMLLRLIRADLKAFESIKK